MIRRVIKLVGLLLVMIIITGMLLYQDYQTYLKTPLNNQAAMVFNVKQGTSFSELNERLASMGLNENTYYFDILARQTGKSTQIKSGEYEIPTGLTPLTLLDLFVDGKVVQYSFTLLEGWNIYQMLDAIKDSNLIINTLNNYEPEQLMSQLGLPEKEPEGLFFPDTYHFPKGTTDKDFLVRAYNRLNKILDQEWQTRAENLPYKTSYEALIMASIIEKETGLASERKTIAGVFVRRLNKNMKLQTDPTVIYAIGKQFDGNIRKKDLKIDSPYNTYRYKGLPPGPISLVGREAIHAALHPEDGKSLFFVSKGDGSHYFSETLAEHNKAVAKYQLKVKRDK